MTVMAQPVVYNWQSMLSVPVPGVGYWSPIPGQPAVM
jgi:hypothetical protein